MDTDQHDIDYYVSALPSRTIEGGGADIISLDFQQSKVYAEKPNPIKEVTERIHLTFASPVSASASPLKKESVNTYSLWSIVAGLLDSSHLMGNPSMKRCNIQFVTQSLKNYLADKTINSFLTGRRTYPLMELLDKPRVDFDKKHQSALGYFLSFLLDTTVSIIDTPYCWSDECAESDINLLRTHEGFWRLAVMSSP